MSTTAAAPPLRHAPLVPIAFAVTAGMLLDRLTPIPPTLSLVAALAGLLLFVLHRSDQRRVLPLLYLWTASAAVACAYHHQRQSAVTADDVRHLAGADPRPVRLRGVIDTTPTLTSARADPLRTIPSRDTVRWVLRVTASQESTTGRWRPASGLLQVSAPSTATLLSIGAGIEVVGRLALPDGPGNPGEFDYARYLAERGIAALLEVRDATSIAIDDNNERLSLSMWLASLHAWGQQVLTAALPAPHGDLAAALLMGDSPGMTTDDWDLYLRTGVIHVLAISGQHLVVLATLLWFALQIGRVPRRRGAVLVALVLLGYALVAGGRPPVMRSAWLMLAYAGGIVLRRPVHPANTFALAWLLVLLWNPADLGNAGCQLSFLAVAVLTWGAPGLASLAERHGLDLFGNHDPLRRLLHESRPLLHRLGSDLGRAVAEAYLLNLLVWLVVTPLAAYHFHLVSPIALVLGPPLVLLTAVALVAGFGVLLLAPLVAPLAWPFAVLTRGSLAACAGLTQLGVDLPAAYFYVPNLPLWWLVPFYAVLLLALATRLPAVRPWLSLALLSTGLTAGLLVTLMPHWPGEFRCTFLAVGHGGCAVIETPGGQTLLYDIGSIAGPDVARRQVAPFLWSRGIRRIDELILSHADLDHFNGIPGLLERFTVSRITHTPTFPQRDMQALALVLADIERRRIPRRTVAAGTRWTCDELTIEVLHPPALGPDGKENVRSLVLLLRVRGLSLLLTGDLEEEGLQRVLALPSQPVDVLMAPHHGSARSSTPQFAAWATPRVVVICQGRRDDTSQAAKAYEPTHATVLSTWPHGAVTVRQTRSAVTVETYRTHERHALALRASNRPP